MMYSLDAYNNSARREEYNSISLLVCIMQRKAQRQHIPVADPDLEKRRLGGGGRGAFCFTCPVGFSSFCHFFFFHPNLRKAREAYLIERGQTLEPKGINKREEI